MIAHNPRTFDYEILILERIIYYNIIDFHIFFVCGPDTIYPPFVDPWLLCNFLIVLIFSHVCKSFLLLSDMTHPTPPHHWTRTSSTTTRQCPSGHLKPPWPLTRPSPRSATSDHNSIKATWSKGRPRWRRSPRRSCNPARRRFPSRPLTIHSTARCSSTRSRSCHTQDWWPATTTQQLSNPWACRRPRPLQPTPPLP